MTEKNMSLEPPIWTSQCFGLLDIIQRHQWKTAIKTSNRFLLRHAARLLILDITFPRLFDPLGFLMDVDHPDVQQELQRLKDADYIVLPLKSWIQHFHDLVPHFPKTLDIDNVRRQLNKAAHDFLVKNKKENEKENNKENDNTNPLLTLSVLDQELLLVALGSPMQEDEYKQWLRSTVNDSIQKAIDSMEIQSPIVYETESVSESESESEAGRECKTQKPESPIAPSNDSKKSQEKDERQEDEEKEELDEKEKKASKEENDVDTDSMETNNNDSQDPSELCLWINEKSRSAEFLFTKCVEYHQSLQQKQQQQQKKTSSCGWRWCFAATLVSTTAFCIVDALCNETTVVSHLWGMLEM